MNTGIRTEHNGGKNGGGYYGNRVEAKEICKKLRRVEGKRQIRAEGY